MTIPVPGFVGGLAPNPITAAINALYGIASDINDWVNRHIEDMKASDNPTISRTGRVLEMAKFGFGLGYLTSVIVIAVGQILLGNTLGSLTTVATAAVLANPIAMTCAAIGAVLYGWGALSDQERNDVLEKLSRGLEVGIELIKSVIGFVIARINEMLDSKVIKDLKTFIRQQAALFGRSLSDVTHSTVDAISDAGVVVRKHAGMAGDMVSEVLTDATRATGETLDAAGSAVKKHTETAIVETRRVAGNAADAVSGAITDLSKATGETVGAASEAAKKALERGKILVQRKKDESPAP